MKFFVNFWSPFAQNFIESFKVLEVEGVILYQSFIAATHLRNIFIRLTSCSEIVRNLFTRMIS